MRFVRADIPEVVFVEPDVYQDARGFFLETYHVEKYRAGGVAGPFVQDNHSRSVAATLRGLHLQRRRPQGKLVRVIEGEVYDVAVDIRRGSPAFGRYVGATLSADNFRQLWVPPGFAHGFLVLTEFAQFEYKCTAFYDPGDELAIAWNDPEIGIKWPLQEPLLSDKDAAAEGMRAQWDRLPLFDETASS